MKCPEICLRFQQMWYVDVCCLNLAYGLRKCAPACGLRKCAPAWTNVSRLRGVNVSCIHLSCQENCWRMVNSMGKLMFVCDNRNQLTKLENFGKMFSFRRKGRQGDCFFLNKRNLLERELSTQYSERKRFVPNQSLETWFVRAFQSGVPFLKPWSSILQSFTKIIFRSILFEFAFYLIHISKVV